MQLSISAEETCNELQKIKKRYGGDIEQGHMHADDILVTFLKNLGYEDIVKAYEDILKWYS